MYDRALLFCAAFRSPEGRREVHGIYKTLHCRHRSVHKLPSAGLASFDKLPHHRLGSRQEEEGSHGLLRYDRLLAALACVDIPDQEVVDNSFE